MASLSIKSETFIQLYIKTRAALERLDKQPRGNAILMNPHPFFPRSVIDSLDQVRTVAESAIRMAGAENSQVVLVGEELRMLEWALTEANK